MRRCTITWGTTLLLLLLGEAQSWIAPHPDSKLEWESVHDMRRRLGVNYNYTTEVIPEEICRYISEEDCKDADKSMKMHIASQRSIQKQRKNNPNLGKIKVLVLMIRFTDHVNRDLIAKEDIDTFWQTKVVDWLELNSQGRYSIDSTVIDWQTTDNSEIHYSMGRRGIVPELQQMAWPILSELDSRPNWDWSDYDMDGNGELDSVVFIHSGYGAETVTTDCFDRDFMDRIWAHAYSSSRNSWKSKDGSMKLNGYTVASAFHGDCDTEPGKMGLTAHEYMHTLGLEDLYDGVDPLAASGVGAFDIMAFPYGQNNDADSPGHLSIWSKVLAEWAEPTVITQNGDFTLKASEISDEAYRINLSGPGEPIQEYLLIENRQPLEFDINIWSSGLVIYHIDDAANLQKNLGHPGQPGWPGNGNHYQVALLPKDGRYDLEKGVNTGDAGDMWEPGDILGPGMGGTVFPNTDRYQNGIIMETGLQIEVLSQDGTDVTFRVGGLNGEPAMQPLMTDSPTAAPTPGINTAAPTTTVTMAKTVAPTVTPATPTPLMPIAPATRPSIPTVSYLDYFNPYEEQPNSTPPPQDSFLSDYETLPPQDSYLSTYDGVSNLRGNDDPAMQKDVPDASGFISMAFETLVTLGGATHTGGTNARPGEKSLPRSFASEKKKINSGRSPEGDLTSQASSTRASGQVFVAVGEAHRVYPGFSRSASASRRGRVSSTACLSMLVYFVLM